ncbi:MAG: hypothetical protein AB7N76_33370 [Planctomycetota bacterium]
MSKHKNPAIAKPSDLVASGGSGRGTLAPEESVQAAIAAGRQRAGLPAPMHMRLHGGEQVELLEDQVFADRVVIRAHERGRALYPSSQAAAWVCQFPRVGSKLRVIPEPLLRQV